MDGHRFQPLHREPRRFFRLLLTSALVGAAVGFVMWLGNTRSALAPGLALAAFVGACIFVVSDLLLTLAAPLVRRLGATSQAIALVGLFFAAGVLGWQLAAIASPWLTGGRWRVAPIGWWLMVALAGGLGASVGGVLYLIERLRDRLAASIVKIKEQEYAERELATAREIQQRLLPPSQLAGEGWRLAARNLPAVVVAGDFYDVFTLADGSLGLAVGDVAGKGMGASLVMASVKGMLPLVAGGRPPNEALTGLNRRLALQLLERQFVALCLISYRPESGELLLANAGLPDPYVLGLDGRPRPLVVGGPRLPLGLREEVAYLSLAERLEPGERLLVFSDGLPEAPTAAGEPLGYGALEAILNDLPPAPDDALTALLARLENVSPPPREDDWTALLLERTR